MNASGLQEYLVLVYYFCIAKIIINLHSHEGMMISDFCPTEQLRPFVKAIKIIESAGNELENRIIPSTSLTIAFRLNGQNAYVSESGSEMLPAISISGLRKSVRLIQYAKQTATLIVLFHEGAAQLFFRNHLHELFEQSLPLNELIQAEEVRIVEEMLSTATTNAQKVRIIERFLMDRLVYTKPDQLVHAAVAKIHSAKGIIKMKDLANSLYISNDVLEKRFRKTVGSSPKQFASIVRMSSIARFKPQERILDVALSSGFYDQAHFNKDFRLFTGLTPNEFYRSADFW